MRKTKLQSIGAMFCMAAMLLQLHGCAPQRIVVAGKEGRPVTILGFGDSITEGGPDFFSYLFPLDSMLRSNGYRAMFIGPRTSVAQGDTLHHAGYSGRNAEYLAARADSIYSLYPADLVLLHTGHNHFVEDAPVPGIIAAQRKIIQTIRAKNPDAVILVAKVITAGKLPKYEYIPALNTAIGHMVDEISDPHVRLVDQQAGWNCQQYTISDKVHPNRTGANLIAAKWFASIRKILKRNP